MVFLAICLAARGDLITSQILDTRNISNNQAYIDNELSQIVSNQFSMEPVQYGFWLYKITYETVDINGMPHIASGSISYPRVDWPLLPGRQAFPILSYQHGTVIEKSSVTSVNGEWILNAILTGHGENPLSLDYLPKNHNIKDGDKVYTSGKEGIFSPGIPIGEVRIEKDKEIVTVSLFSDLSQITFINVDLGDLEKDK